MSRDSELVVDGEGSIVTWNAQERIEVNKLWDKVHDLDSTVDQLKIQTTILQEQTATQAKELHKSTGQIMATLLATSKDLRELSDKVLTLTVQMATKGGMVKEWLSVGLALLAIGIAYAGLK